MKTSLFEYLLEVTEKGYSIDIRKDYYTEDAIRVTLVNNIEPRKKYTFVEVLNKNLLIDVDVVLRTCIEDAVKALEEADGTSV